MRHGEERTGDSGGGCGGEDLIEKRNEDSEAFERKTFGAEIALLDDLLEEIGANELGEDVFLIGLGGGLLDSLLQPLTLLEAGDVHELDGEISAVVAARLG